MSSVWLKWLRFLPLSSMVVGGSVYLYQHKAMWSEVRDTFARPFVHADWKSLRVLLSPLAEQRGARIHRLAPRDGVKNTVHVSFLELQQAIALTKQQKENGVCMCVFERWPNDVSHPLFSHAQLGRRKTGTLRGRGQRHGWMVAGLRMFWNSCFLYLLGVKNLALAPLRRSMAL